MSKPPLPEPAVSKDKGKSPDGPIAQVGVKVPDLSDEVERLAQELEAEPDTSPTDGDESGEGSAPGEDEGPAPEAEPFLAPMLVLLANAAIARKWPDQPLHPDESAELLKHGTSLERYLMPGSLPEPYNHLAGLAATGAAIAAVRVDWSGLVKRVTKPTEPETETEAEAAPFDPDAAAEMLAAGAAELQGASAGL